MSFDPQNPRGSAQPTPTPSQPNYIPPQPVNSGPSRALIVAGVVIAVLLLGIVVLLVLNLLKSPAAVPSPSVPGATTAPTSTGTQGPSLVPSSALPSTPTPSGLPTPGQSALPPSAGTPEAELLSHIPEALQPTCTQQTAASSPGIYMASCTASEGAITVNYSQYASVDLMNAAYGDVFQQAQIDANSGSCENHVTWPAEGSYEVGGETAGRRLCTDQPGAPTIYWTDERLNILSNATATDGDAGALIQFWTNEAGPIP